MVLLCIWFVIRSVEKYIDKKPGIVKSLRPDFARNTPRNTVNAIFENFEALYFINVVIT